MSVRKSVAAGAIAASLAIGGVAGATVFAPQLTNAQEADEPATPATPAEATDEAKRPGRPMGHHLDAIAETIGISADDLRTALRGGQSIAEIAEANDVDPQVVIDQLVEQARTSIEERLAELPAHIEDFVNGEFTGHRFRPDGDGPFGDRRGPFGGHGSSEPGETTTTTGG